MLQPWKSARAFLSSRLLWCCIPLPKQANAIPQDLEAGGARLFSPEMGMGFLSNSSILIMDINEISQKNPHKVTKIPRKYCEVNFVDIVSLVLNFLNYAKRLALSSEKLAPVNWDILRRWTTTRSKCVCICTISRNSSTEDTTCIDAARLESPSSYDIMLCWHTSYDTYEACKGL